MEREVEKFTVETIENGYILGWGRSEYPWEGPRSVYYKLECDVVTRIEEVLLERAKVILEFRQSEKALREEKERAPSSSCSDLPPDK
jgi:hypothetical protein